jgi:hypothetical protein
MKNTMDRAGLFLNMFEGFKLGDLGAGKKKFLHNRPQQKITGPRSFDHNSLGDCSWEEPAEPWASILQLETNFFDYPLIISLHLIPDNNQLVPELFIMAAGEDEEATFTYDHKSVKIKRFAGNPWLDGHLSALEQHGLKALNFPHDWKLTSSRRS